MEQPSLMEVFEIDFKSVVSYFWMWTSQFFFILLGTNFSSLFLWPITYIYIWPVSWFVSIHKMNISIFEGWMSLHLEAHCICGWRESFHCSHWRLLCESYRGQSFIFASFYFENIVHSKSARRFVRARHQNDVIKLALGSDTTASWGNCAHEIYILLNSFVNLPWDWSKGSEMKMYSKSFLLYNSNYIHYLWPT